MAQAGVLNPSVYLSVRARMRLTVAEEKEEEKEGQPDLPYASRISIDFEPGQISQFRFFHVNAELSLLRRDRIVALAGGHAITMASSLNLYLAKAPIPVCVVGIISEAVLVVQLFRNLIEGVGDFVHATRFNQPASGVFSQLS